MLVTPYNERIVYTRVGRPKYRLQGYRWRSFMFDTPSPINQLRKSPFEPVGPTRVCPPAITAPEDAVRFGALQFDYREISGRRLTHGNVATKTENRTLYCNQIRRVDCCVNMPNRSSQM